MCKKCCSHAALSLPCDPQSTFHIGHFSLTSHGILFPGEHLYLSCHVASTLHLVSEVHNKVMTPSSHPTWPDAKLLSNVLAISPSPTSMYGVIAVLHYVRSARCMRFLTNVVGRYSRISPPDYHRPYPCVNVQLICEAPPLTLREPLSSAFPHVHPIRRSKSPAVLTRSAVQLLRRTARRRSSMLMGGISYNQWIALQPESLVRRAITFAPYAALRADKLMMDRVPDCDACPSAWSFWFCAALADDTDPDIMEHLQAETLVIVRLRKIIELFEKRFLPRKKRTRQEDTPYRASFSKRTRFSAPPEFGRASNDKNSSRVAMNTQRAQESLESILQHKPWPCSTHRGFESVNPRYPCKGRFRQRPAPMVAPTQLSSRIISSRCEPVSPLEDLAEG